MTYLSSVEECMIIERKAEVRYFGVVVFRDEYVSRGQITVYNILRLQVFHSATCVTERMKYEI